MTAKKIRRLSAGHGPAPFRRGVAVLPSLLTVGNMFFGYYAILLASKHHFEWAVTMIILAGILDGLDGRIARMTGSTSEFGKELDSLSDFLSFGLAPALILYHWGFADLGKTGWFFAFLLPVAGALRLARFNVQTATQDKRYFVGLPIPAAAAAAVLPLYYLPPGLTNVQSPDLLRTMRIACLVYVVALSWLMVSTVRFRSFKDMDILRARRPSAPVFVMAVVLVLIALNPPAALLIIAVAYALSGPVGWLWGRLRKRPAQAPAGKAPADQAQEEAPTDAQVPRP